MGYHSCEEIWTGRDGEFDDSFDRKWSRKWRVITDDKRMGPIAVIAHPALPPIYSPYESFLTGEFDTLALLRRYTAAPDPEADTPFAWIVTAEYSTAPASGDRAEGQADNPGVPGGGGAGGGPAGGSGASNSPDLEPPAWDWDFEDVLDYPTRDRDGKPLANSARDPFDPPIGIPTGCRVLNYERNELAFDHASGDYDFLVNADVFQGYDAGYVLCAPPRAKRQFRGSLPYFRVRYKFTFRPLTLGKWHPFQVLDQGTRELIDGKHVQINDDVWKQAVSAPVLLNGAGRKAAVVNNVPQPVYVPFTIYRTGPFKPLNIKL